MTLDTIASQMREPTGFDEEWLLEHADNSTTIHLCHAFMAWCLTHPGVTYAESLEAVRRLTLAERDWLLLRLRMRCFGDVIHADAYCPSCCRHSELDFSSMAILAEQPDPLPAQSVDLSRGREVLLRPLTAFDHEEFANTGDLDPDAQFELALHHSLENPSDDLTPIPLDDRARLEQHLAELNPEEIHFAWVCPECGMTADIPFDLCSHVIAEFHEHARTLLDDVHTLACRYHWSEPEILALPLRRRLSYLMRIEAEQDRALLLTELGP